LPCLRAVSTRLFPMSIRFQPPPSPETMVDSE
jgi:hypothetical protein